MRVRMVGYEELAGKRIVAARYGSLDRAPDDVGFQCGTCSFVLEVTAAVAADPLAAFRCPHCGQHSAASSDGPSV